MRRFLGFFRSNYFFRVLVFAFCFGGTVAWNPATAAEMSPETRDLFQAVQTGDMGAVKRTLLAGADINGENASGLTPVDVAIDANNFKIAHYLLAWRKHRQSARRPRIAIIPTRPPEQPAPAQPVPETVRSYVVKKEPVAPLPAAPSAPETPAAAEPYLPPQPSPPERTVVIIEPPERAVVIIEPPERTVVIIEPPERAPEAEQGMFDRLAGIFSFGSEDDGASAGKVLDIRNVPAAEAPAEPTAETAVAPEPDSPASSEPVAPAEQIAKTGPDMLERIAGFFSFGSEDAEATAEIAAAPEPEPTAEPEAELTPAIEAPAETTVETAAASSEPVAPAEQIAKTGPDMLDRLSSFFSFESKVDDSTTQPTSKPAPVAEPVPPPSPAPAPETPGAKTETAQASPVAALKAVGAVPEKRVRLVFGRSVRLGKTLAPGTGDICVEKSTPSFWFCIEPVDWPDRIAAAFQVRTILYRGTQVIVRYEKGAATQFHALFPVGNFEAIVGYFNASLGAPGKQSNNWAILPAEPNRRNRTVRWRGAGNSVLEIREIDDLRWSSMPDIRHGVVRMYVEDPDPVFRHVSWSDFMLARIPHKRR